jgi:hypothetical protein
MSNIATATLMGLVGVMFGLKIFVHRAEKNCAIYDHNSNSGNEDVENMISNLEVNLNYPFDRLNFRDQFCYNYVNFLGENAGRNLLRFSHML